MIPVIISGGSGTRLWPVSRASYPKQFCEFYDQSFLKNTMNRLTSFGQPCILTVETMKTMSARLLKELDLPLENLVCEPMGRNTAPAAALICHLMALKGRENEVMGLFPADHLVLDEKAFSKTLKIAVESAEQGNIVTLGIEPRYPATGYGYIELQEKSGELNTQAYKVERFCEKPELAKAKEFVETGKHFWNSGMFVFKVSQMIEHFKEHQPDIWKKISLIDGDLENAKINYANIESISLDYAIMEKIKEITCIPCDIGWSDVGSWDEIARLADEMPEFRSQVQPAIFSDSSQSNYIFSQRNKVFGMVGVKDLIVVDTPDALLIAEKGKSENVKAIVDGIKKAGLPEATEHPFEFRPWGGFEVLSDDSQFKAKKITVDPQAQLSYQSHERRVEHWIIIKGQAEVTLNGEVHKMSSGQYIHVPFKAKHRIKNSGSEPLVFVEVQTGDYFGEDDIQRYEDDYNRA